MDYIGNDQVKQSGFGSKEMVCNFDIFTKIKSQNDAFLTTVDIDGVKCEMEIDTGSKYSLMGEENFKQLFPRRDLHPTNIGLRTYSGEKLIPRGFRQMNVTIGENSRRLRLYILPNNGPTLLGRDWIRALSSNNNATPNLCSMGGIINTGQDDAEFKREVTELVEKFDDLFSQEPGELKGVLGTLHLKETAIPQFQKARPLPFAMRGRVEDELDRLEKSNLFYPVSWSRWASPVVPILKKDGSVRLCGDFKRTLNPHLNCEQYPLPKVDDIFAGLAGGKYFAKLDLVQAYLNMVMDEQAQELLTINTHKGLYRSRRLLYGVNSAAGIWQRNMELVIQGLQRTNVILDDIIVTGRTKEEFLSNLGKLLTRLRGSGLKLNKTKCKFFEKQIEYCGYRR